MVSVYCTFYLNETNLGTFQVPEGSSNLQRQRVALSKNIENYNTVELSYRGANSSKDFDNPKQSETPIELIGDTKQEKMDYLEKLIQKENTNNFGTII